MNKSWNKKLWLLYQCSLILIVGVFLVRAMSGEYITKASDGQVIHLSKLYQMGKFYDRDENDITNEEMYEQIIEPQIGKTKNKKSSVAGVTPWVFGLEDDRFQLGNLLNPNEKRVGGDAKLTYDSNLMKKVEHLVEERGYEDAYVVVSNWKTGELLATYGDVYTEQIHPGSTIKPILAAAVLSINPDLKNFLYNCTIENHNYITKEDVYHIQCAGGVYHGSVGMEKALAKSCNGYFISLIQQVPKEDLLKVLENWGFGSVKSYEQFFYWDQSFLGNSSKELDYLLAAIGQANVQITPFAMNLCTNALISGTGMIHEPQRVVAKRVASEEEWSEISIERSHVFCEESVAQEVQNYLLEVPKSGTLRKHSLEGLAAKTGTAQYENYNAIWTTGGLIFEETPYSVTVCINQVDKYASSTEAGSMVKEILTYMIGGSEE